MLETTKCGWKIRCRDIRETLHVEVALWFIIFKPHTSKTIEIIHANVSHFFASLCNVVRLTCCRVGKIFYCQIANQSRDIVVVCHQNLSVFATKFDAFLWFIVKLLYLFFFSLDKTVAFAYFQKETLLRCVSKQFTTWADDSHKTFKVSSRGFHCQESHKTATSWKFN